MAPLSGKEDLAVLPPRKVHVMSIKGSSGEAPTHADPSLLEDFQGKQREVTNELYTLQEVGSC